MKKTILNIIILFFLSPGLFKSALHAKTGITTTGLASEIENFDTASSTIKNDFENTAKENGPYVADAFALANILGYPIGKSYLGSLPHFEIGASAGAGCTNMKYFDDDVPDDRKGAFPMIIPNAVAHFGLGIGGGMDILGKFFYIDKTVYDPGLSTDKAKEKADEDSDEDTKTAELDDFKIYSVGTKVRYNLVDKFAFLPILLEFGGLTVSLGGDLMYGRFSIMGGYEQDLSETDIQYSGAAQNVDMRFSGDYTTIIEWSIFSLTAQVIGYMDIFYIFSLYTGFGVTGNIGYFDIDFSGNGDLLSEDFADLTGSPQIGGVTFLTENRFRPEYVIPTYILGLEINILIVKLNIETMVNLHNGSDVNIQAGTRIGI